MKKLFFSFLAFVFIGCVSAQNLSKINDITFGGQGLDESIYSFRDTSGNFYTFGTIQNSSVPKDLSVQYGGEDYSVVKYAANGNKIWDNAYGGDSDDHLYKVMPVADGFMLIGVSYSSNSGSKTTSITCASSFPSALFAPKRVIWIIKIDFDGNMTAENQICTSWNVFDGANTYSNPFIDKITDFKQLSNGQYILCGNFIGYGGPTSSNYYLSNMAAYVRFDANFNMVATRVLSSNLFTIGASSYILYSPLYGPPCGEVIEFSNKNLMISYTVINTYQHAGCGDLSANKFAVAYTSMFTSGDVQIGYGQGQAYGSHKGNSWAKKLVLLNNNAYLFTEHIPLPTNTVDINTCIAGSFYYRTSAARTITGKKDCWVIKVSSTNVPQAEYAYGANSDVTIGDVILDKGNNFVVGMSVNSAAAFDKTTPAKGGNDYWVVRVNSTNMSVTNDFCLGGSADDYLKGLSHYNDVFFFSGYSFSDAGLDKTGSNRGTSLTYDQWTVLMCQVPAAPTVQNVGGFGILVSCQNETATMNIKNPISGYTYNWYTSSTGPAIFTGSAYTTPTNLMAGTNYWVDANNGYCSSSRNTFQLTPISKPNVPISLTNPAVCKGDTLRLIAKPDTAGQGANFKYIVRWYDSDGLTVLHTGDTLKIPNFQTGKTFYASIVWLSSQYCRYWYKIMSRIPRVTIQKPTCT